MRSEFALTLPTHWIGLAAVFSALGDSYRQRILLMFEPGERLTIKQVCDVLPLSRSAVMHHVRVLQAAELLQSSKEGRDVYLSVNKALVTEALSRTLLYAQESL